MSSRQLGPEWVLSRFISPVGAAQDEISELVMVAQRLWPRIQMHAHREEPEKNSEEALALVMEVWEGVLQSVAKTIQRSNRKNWRIKNTEAYLFGAFHHRFNRALRKERRRRETMQYLPSTVIWSAYDRRMIQSRARSGAIDPGQRSRSKDGWVDSQGMGCSAVRIFMEGNRSTSGPNGASGQTSISLCDRQATCSVGPRCVIVASRTGLH